MSIKKAVMTKSSSKIKELSQRFLPSFEQFGLLTLVAMMLMAWLAWGLGGGQFIVDYLCPNIQGSEECERVKTLGAVGDIFGGVNALFAALAFVTVAISTYQAAETYRQDRQLEHDEVYVNQVKLTYEWAHAAFTRSGDRPPADNLLWLDAARHLLRAKSIGELVKTEAYQVILAEHTEHWRRKFYLTLENLADGQFMVSPNYFGDYVKDGDFFKRIPHVNGGAAKVVVSFAIWPENRTDPIDQITDDDVKNWDQGKAGRGLRQHLELLAESRARADERWKKNKDNQR